MEPDRRVDWDDLETASLEHGERVQRDLDWSLEDPGHDVDDLGGVDRTDLGRPRRLAQLPFDIVCRRLIAEERDDRLRIEDGQTPVLRSESASSSRVCFRASADDGPSAIAVGFSDPRAAAIGSFASGRMTTSSPRSSTRTRSVFHRRRMAAGTEI
jgi:hypothetical protein